MHVNQNGKISVYNWLKNKLLRPVSRCRLCSEALTPGHYICAYCQQQLQPVSSPVCFCNLPCGEADSGKLCGRCINQPPLFSDCHCAWYYQFPLDHLINRYKHESDLSIEPLLEEIWLHRLCGVDTAADALVPIPVHWWRFARRGFNQSARLSYRLSQHLAIRVLPALKQPQTAPLLQGMSAKQRRYHSRGRFSVTIDVSQQHLILIDDVMTTGATANEAARELLAAGAARVDLWALCRVPPPNQRAFTHD